MTTMSAASLTRANSDWNAPCGVLGAVQIRKRGNSNNRPGHNQLLLQELSQAQGFHG